MLKKAVAVKVRPLQKEDLAKMVVWNTDPEVERYVDLGLPGDLDACLTWWQEMKQCKEVRLFALEDEAGKLIGDLELAHICWRGGEAEVRIRIGEKDYWNRGYGALALQQVIHYAFTELGLNRLYLRVYAFNTRAIKCYQKIGFKKEAVLKRAKDRNWKDIYLMTLENKPSAEGG